MAPPAAWLPRQHGAWAMLIVPFIVGTVLACRAEVAGAWLIPLAAAELSAYFGFNTLTLFLRSPVSRRQNLHRPLITYSALTAVLATLALVLGAWRLAWWLMVAAPLFFWAIRQTAHHRERDVSSGLATVALASGVGLAIRFHSPGQILNEWPQAAPDLVVLCWMFAHFAGTVWHIKAMIRERGLPRARRRTCTWHALVLASTALVLVQHLSLAWPVFFTITLARTTWMTAPQRTTSFSAKQLGVTEIFLSLGVLAVALT